MLDDGKTVEGALVGLDTLPVRLGGQELTLKLADAVELRCEVLGAESVSYTIIATVGGKEVGRLADTLTSAAPAPIDVPRGDAGRIEIKPPVLEQDKVVKALPGAVGDSCLAGGGRYLILHFPKLRKLGVFDVSEAKIVGYINVGEDNIQFAAGMDRVLVVLPTARLLQPLEPDDAGAASCRSPCRSRGRSRACAWAGRGLARCSSPARAASRTGPVP